MDIGYILIALAAVLVSMTLHEAMHGFVAYWLGDDTARLQGRLTLNPLRHIDPILTIGLPLVLAAFHLPIFGGAKPVPLNPKRIKYDEWGAALVALAGPLTNFILAFIFYGLWALVGGTTGFLNEVLSTAVEVNLGFFVFNMIPIPPLDGSRVLYALAPDFVRRGMEWVERYGIMFVFFIVMFASPVIGILIYTVVNLILDLFAHIFVG